MTVSRRKTAVLSPDEQAALLKQPNRKAPTGLRNLCLITLMLKAGLRAGEALAVKTEDISWQEGQIHIPGSGAAKERVLWLDQELVELLEKWRRRRPSGSAYFFTTLRGEPLQDRYLREMVKRLARKAGINKDVHPHLLRSTFAVNLIKETNDIRLAQHALGHRDVSTTQSYVKHLFNEHSMTYYNILGYRRSGIPAGEKSSLLKSEREQTADRPDDWAQQSLEFPGSAGGKNNYYHNKVIIKNDSQPATGPEEAGSRPVDEESNLYRKEAEGSEERMEENLDENIFVESKKDAVGKPVPRMNFDAELSEGNKKPIPALKCSSCSYILKYQGDCPKCGAEFFSILEHWRRNI